MLAAFCGGAFAVFEFAAFPADVFGLGFEVFHFAGGEAELALQGREFDLLALQAFAGDFDFLAQALAAAVKALASHEDGTKKTAEAIDEIRAIHRRARDGELTWSDWAKLSKLAPGKASTCRR